jgi:hypothetical protein
VPLTAKAFDVLLLLIQNAGRTVTKEELMRRPGRTGPFRGRVKPDVDDFHGAKGVGRDGPIEAAQKADAPAPGRSHMKRMTCI